LQILVFGYYLFYNKNFFDFKNDCYIICKSAKIKFCFISSAFILNLSIYKIICIGLKLIFVWVCSTASSQFVNV